MTANWSPPNWLWGYFIPAGLLLLTWGGFHPQKARRITFLAGFSLAITAVCYWAVGFAFHMGGAQAVQPDNPGLKGLSMLYTLLPDQPGWGFIGLDAFFLSGNALVPEVYGFFLSYLPLVATSVLLVSLSLVEVRRWLVLLASVLASAVVLPVALCWVWGSGWLAHLGGTMGFGNGYVDFGGSSLILWIPSLMVFGILLVQKSVGTQDHIQASPPMTFAPLVSNMGSLLMGIGWMGWALSNPFHVAGANISWGRTALSMVLGMAGAALTSQLYAWLVLGAPEVLIAARGFAAGWAALLVGAPFLTPWVALILGLLAGFIFPFVHYAVESRRKFHTAAASLALGLTAGPIGAFSVALFANGQWGQGWNNVEAITEGIVAGTTSTGVSGVFVARDIEQLKAQVIGLVALGLWGLLWGVAFGLFTRIFFPHVMHTATQNPIHGDELSDSIFVATETVETVVEIAQHMQPDVLDEIVQDVSQDFALETPRESSELPSENLTSEGDV